MLWIIKLMKCCRIVMIFIFSTLSFLHSLKHFLKTLQYGYNGAKIFFFFFAVQVFKFQFFYFCLWFVGWCIHFLDPLCPVLEKSQDEGKVDVIGLHPQSSNNTINKQGSYWNSSLAQIKLYLLFNCTSA